MKQIYTYFRSFIKKYKASFTKSIAKKVMVKTFLILMMFLVIYSLLLFITGRKTLLPFTKEYSSHIAKQTKVALIDWIQSHIMLVQTIAKDTRVINVVSDPVNPAYYKDAQLYLDVLYKHYGYFENVPLAKRMSPYNIISLYAKGKMHTIKNGTFFIDTTKGEIIGKGGIGYSYVNSIFDGKPYFISEVYPSITAGNPIFVISAPVKKNHKIIGISFLALQIKYFTHKFISKFKFFNKGYMFIINNQGVVIAHPDKNKILKKDRSLLAILNTALENKNYLEQSYNGKMKIFHTQKINIEKANMANQWYIITVQDKQEVFFSLYNFISYSFLIFLILSIVLAVIIEKILNNTFKPLKDLQKLMNLVEKGNLDVQAKVDSTDEVGELSHSFNLMIASQKNAIHQIKIVENEKIEAQKTAIEAQEVAYSDLENEVQKRTKHLEEVKLFTESIIEKSPIAIHTIDKAGTVTLVNKALLKIINSSTDFLSGTNIFDWQPIKNSKFKNIYKKALMGIPFQSENEFFQVSEDTEYYLNIVIAPVLVKGEMDYVLTMYYDNTEKAMVEKGLYNAMKAMSEDLSMAKKIQMNLLQPEDKSIYELNIDIFFEPMIEVGGDIYDIFKLHEHVYRIFIADSTGHGVQAAMMTMLIKSEYEKIKIFDDTVETVLELLNINYYNNYEHLNTYFTAVLIDINTETKTLRLASAGHPPQLLIEKGKIIEIKPKGTVMGVSDFQEMEGAEIAYNSGSKLVLFTDGIEEAHSKGKELFGVERFRSILRKHNNETVDKLNTIIIREVNKWRRNRQSSDDITLISIEL